MDIWELRAYVAHVYIFEAKVLHSKVVVPVIFNVTEIALELRVP